MTKQEIKVLHTVGLVGLGAGLIYSYKNDKDIIGYIGYALLFDFLAVTGTMLILTAAKK